MTIKDDLYFVYNGINSEDLGIINVSVEEIWVDEPFLATRTVNSLHIKNKDRPYFMGVSKEPLRLSLTFAFESEWDEDLIQEVAKLFHVNYYKPLYFSENEDRIFYCMYDGDPRILHYKLKQGYIQMELICNDICAYSRMKEVQYEDLTGTNNNVTFINRGHLDIYPEIILKTNNINISINNTTTGKILTMTDISIGEEIYIDNDNEIITTDHLTIEHRYYNHNNIFLKMNPNRNNLILNGINDIYFKWRFKLLQN